MTREEIGGKTATLWPRQFTTVQVLTLFCTSSISSTQTSLESRTWRPILLRSEGRSTSSWQPRIWVSRRRNMNWTAELDEQYVSWWPRQTLTGLWLYWTRPRNAGHLTVSNDSATLWREFKMWFRFWSWILMNPNKFTYVWSAAYTTVSSPWTFRRIKDLYIHNFMIWFVTGKH